MKKSFYTLTLILIALSIGSCTTSNVGNKRLIQKRKYTSGFFVKNSQKFNTPEDKVTQKSELVLVSENNLSQTLADHQEVLSLPVLSQENNQVIEEKLILPQAEIQLVKNKLNTKKNQDDCDLIVLKNGEQIFGKVTEVNIATIKYINCDGTGPTYTVAKSQVLSITYPNGRKDEFGRVNQRVEEASNDLDEALSEENGSSQLVALLLCILLGAFGAHRFYLGYTGMGILYIFTFGLCGIGILIDLILIITGDLKPKRGEYGSKL